MKDAQRSFSTKELYKGCRFLGNEKLTIGVFGGHGEERNFRMLLVTLEGRRSKGKFENEALKT